jgi:hypothetical protein
MTHDKQDKPSDLSTKHYRIPDGTKVKPRGDVREGVIDGVTEIVDGGLMNADSKTQYRIRMTGTAEVKLVGDLDLLFMVDRDGLVVMPRQAVAYRSYVTKRLRSVFAEHQFVA